MVYTSKIKIVKGGRSSVSLTLKNFKELLYKKLLDALIKDGYTKTEAEEELDRDWAYIIEYIIDIHHDCSVQFDRENISSEDEFLEIAKGTGHLSDILGFHEEDSFCWFGINAGGDWENPVFFIVYYDGKNFRAYFPEAGNVFNEHTKDALGNDPSDPDDAEASVELLKEDFLSRIEIGGIPVIDIKGSSYTGAITPGSATISIDKESLEDLLDAISCLTEEDMIKDLVKNFADKNGLDLP